MKPLKFLDQFFDAYEVVPLPKNEIVTIFKRSDETFRQKVFTAARESQPWLKSKKSEAFFGFGTLYCVIASVILSYAIHADRAYRKVLETTTIGDKVYEKLVEIVDPKMLNRLEAINILGYASAGVFLLCFIYYRSEVQKYDDVGSRAARQLKTIYMTQADKVSQTFKDRKNRVPNTREEVTNLSLFDGDED